MKAAIAVALLGVLILTGIPLTANGDATVNWGGFVPETGVPQGQVIPLYVYGPPGGNFTVSVEVLPFNYSAPVSVLTYELPTGVNATGYAMANVTIPTSHLNRGPVQLKISNNSVGDFEFIPLLVTDPVNITNLENQLNNLQFNYTILDLRERALLNGQGVEDANYWYNAIVYTVQFFITLIVILLTRTRVSERNLSRRLREGGHRWTHEPAAAYFGDPTEIRVSPPNPDRIYYCPMFPKCLTCKTPQYREELIRHLKAKVNDDGSLGHGIPNPTEPDFIAKHRATVKEVAARSETTQANTKLLAKRVAKLPDDLLSDLR